MTEQRPRVDTITDNDLDQLLAVQAHLADAVAEMTGLTVAVVLDEARQATAPEQPDDAEPLELPRDTVQALHDLTAQLLGTQPSEALRLSEQRLEQVLADRERERHVLTGKMRENEQLRAQVNQLTTRLGEYADRGIVNGQRADQTEAALIKARRRIGELATSLDQAHDGNSGLWRAHAESVSKAGELQAAIDRVRALHQPVTSVAAAEAGIAPDCGTCDTQPYPCPTIRALDAAEPS